MSLKWYFLLYFLICSLIGSFAQGSDFQTWVNIEVKGEILKKLDYSVSPEIRTFDNSTRVKTMLAEIDLSVPFFKNFRVGGIYRPERDISGEYTSKINRFCIYGGAQYNLDRFRLSYRGIYQHEYKDYNTSKNGHIPSVQHRHKLSVKYNIKRNKITPSFAVELFNTLRPYDEKEEKKIRYSLGADYKISKRLSCSAAYKLQNEFYVNNPETIHVVSLSLGYEF